MTGGFVEDGFSRRSYIRLRLACASIGQGDYKQCLKVCGDVIGSMSPNRDQTQMVQYL